MAEQVDILIVQDAGQSSQPSSKEKEPEKLATAICLGQSIYCILYWLTQKVFGSINIPPP
jgi:hypothetical protein